ncbi:MAG: DNA primase [Burkholderiales bacterium]
MIPKSFIQDLLGRVDIVDVVETAVQLKRSGSNLVACCPFHTEKSPSFTVSPTKQFYHCFGCGAHGTAISFMMEYHGLGFVEAVQELAQRAGMVVPEVRTHEMSSEAVRSHAVLPEVLARAARYYKEQLKQSETAIQYLKGRGLSGEIAARFGLGYAPPGWQNLADAFDDYESAAALVEAGLVIRNEEGRRYDRFRDRIMFPIVNPRGDIIGFGGRVLGTGEPKYLNSPETAVFEKGRELYGYFQARQGIRKRDRAVVVEGYMDVVALAQFGVDNAVATLGTATSATHVQTLLRAVDRVTFCFDGDAAGRRAAWRALEVSLPTLSDGKLVSFLFLPEKDDPDSFVRAHGAAAFEERLDAAEPLSTVMIRELRADLDVSTPEGRAAFLKRAEPLLAQISARNLGVAMRDAVARVAGVVPDSLTVVPVQAQPVRSGRPREVPSSRIPEGLDFKVLVALTGAPQHHRLAARAADLGGSTGYWPLVSELSALLEEREVGATTVAVLQHFEADGRSDLAGQLQLRLLDEGDEPNFEDQLLGTVSRLERTARDQRLREVASQARSLSALGPEERALFTRPSNSGA